ncbi:hypothetical protein FOA52_002218 [Chlamydomonas sp. UWO 241]|nr:hypothetical protein FOA52_002218 [Chlamydomonas sp. UWO 241]
MEIPNTGTDGGTVLSGLSGMLICSHLSNVSLRILSECSRDLHTLASTSVKELAPKGASAGALTQRFAYLQSLDLSKGERYPRITLRDASSFRFLKHLCLQKFTGLCDAGLGDLRAAQSLTSLDLRGCSKLTWSGLGHLHQLPNLRTLNCSGVKYTGRSDDTADDGDGDSSDARLRRVLGRLESLTMGDACTLSWVDDSLMGMVGEAATALLALDCGGCIDVTDTGVGHIRGLSRLRALSLQSCVRLTNGCLSYVGELTSLRALNLRGCLQMTQAGLAQLAGLAQFSDLVLSCCQGLSRLDARPLSSFIRLSSLNLSGCAHLESVDEVGACLGGSLTSLSLSGCAKLRLDGLAALSRLTGLTSLDMSELRNQAAAPPGTDAALLGLSSLTRLEVLNLSRLQHPTGTPTALLRAVARMAALRQLLLAGCSPEEASTGGDAASRPGSQSQLWFVEDLTQLELLDVSGWRHGAPADLASLSALPSLTHLKLQRFGNDAVLPASGSADAAGCVGGNAARHAMGAAGSSGGGAAAPHCWPVHASVPAIRCPRPSLSDMPGSGSGGSCCEGTARYSATTAIAVAGHAGCFCVACVAASATSEGGCGTRNDAVTTSFGGGCSSSCSPGSEEIGSLASKMAAVGIAPATTRTAATPHLHRCSQQGSQQDTAKCHDALMTSCSTSSSQASEADSVAWGSSTTQLSQGQSLTLSQSSSDTQHYPDQPLRAHAAHPTTKPSRRSSSSLQHDDVLDARTSTGNGHGCSAFDDAMLHVGRCAALQELDMEACKGLGDDGIIHLAGLAQLQRLHLTGCSRLTGATLHALAPTTAATAGAAEGAEGAAADAATGCPRLHHLVLDDCPRVCDASLLCGAARLPSLASLSLRGCTRIGDAGLEALACGASAAKLANLYLFSATSVTSAGVASLARLPALRALHLTHCWQVGDAGVVQLSACRVLSYLNVQHCWRVSPGALNMLQQASPALSIVE